MTSHRAFPWPTASRSRTSQHGVCTCQFHCTAFIIVCLYSVQHQNQENSDSLSFWCQSSLSVALTRVCAYTTFGFGSFSPHRHITVLLHHNTLLLYLLHSFSPSIGRSSSHTIIKHPYTLPSINNTHFTLTYTHPLHILHHFLSFSKVLSDQ